MVRPGTPCTRAVQPPAPVLSITLRSEATDLKTGPLIGLVDTGADATIVPIRRLDQIGAEETAPGWLRGITGERVPVGLLLDGPAQHTSVLDESIAARFRGRRCGQHGGSMSERTEVQNPIIRYVAESEVVRILHAVDAKFAAAERKQARLAELFRALLRELMTGRIRVDESMLSRPLAGSLIDARRVLPDTVST